MAHTFKAFTLSNTGRIIGPPAEITAESDVEALLEAGKWGNIHDVEVWEGDRLVAKLDRLKPATR